jgi:type IV secretion system protein VirD4
MLELILIQRFLYFILGVAWLYGGYSLIHKGNKLATARLGNKTDLKGLLGENGINLSKKLRLNEKTSFEHPLILGPTGAGKTTALFLPNLLSNHLRGSIIVADPKGELFKLTSKYQQSIGRKTIQFKPLEKGISYNPLKNCKNDREVIKLAQNLLINGALSFELSTGKKTGGTEWLQMSQSLLSAALLYVKDTPIEDIKNALGLIINHDSEELEQIFSHAKESVKMQYNAFKMCLDSPKTMGSIKITLSSNLSLFLDNLPIKFNDFTAEDLRKEETIIYVTYPENMAYYLSPFTAAFYSQLIDHLIDSYKDDSNPIYFMFDEFANIGMLNAFSLNIAQLEAEK